jgi:hypothetical protein
MTHEQFEHREQEAEVLISRVVDGEATARDWDRFRAIADQDPTLWREMAEYQHDHGAVVAMVSQAIAIADEVEAPTHEDMEERLRNRLRILASWGGWAAAASLAVMWGVGQAKTTGPILGSSAGIVPGLNTPSDFLKGYLQQGQATGQVVGEMPEKILVETRALPEGQGYEVYYIRQIIERTTVPDLFMIGTDEAGRPVPVPLEIRADPRLGPT